MRNRSHLDWNNEIRNTMGRGRVDNLASDDKKRELLKKLKKERIKNRQADADHRKLKKEHKQLTKRTDTAQEQ